VVLAALLGAFFGLCLLKFSNPPIMEKYVEIPKNGYELLANTPWPIHWAYWPLAGLALAALLMVFWSQSFRAWVLGLHSSFVIRISSFSLLGWLLWQVLATHFSVRHDLSNPTLLHYTACVVCFYLGLFVLSRVGNLWPFWLGILCGFILVVAIGLDQHFGGLAESRAYFYHQQELYPDKELAPELLKKIASNRIYSTLFYPNTLAGALLLLSPAMLLVTLQSGDRWRFGNASRWETLSVLIAVCLACIFLYLLNTHAGWIFILALGLGLIFPLPRWVAPAVLGLGVLAVLFWSGSKAGWLIMLLLAIIALLRFPFSRSADTSSPSTTSNPPVTHHASRIKLLIIAFLLLAGLTGFFVRYATFFRTGATSVSARFDYWRAALGTARAHPFFGTGPGTFQVPYAQLKRPEAEMARLVHNDYLQQASDSGIPGFLLYTAFITATLLATHPRMTSVPLANPSFVIRHSSFVIWLGTLGWALQCLVEFSLQIPALAWLAFALLGCLCGTKWTKVSKEMKVDAAG
jgi:O-antigen ligase